MRSPNRLTSQKKALCKRCSKLKDTEKIGSVCLECNGTVKQRVVNKSKHKIRSTESSNGSVIRERRIVICNGKKGIYHPELNLVECMCGECGPSKPKQSLNKWESHTGCKAKKWKVSVIDKLTMSPLWKVIRSNNITIVCNGVEGVYLSDLLLVECKCGLCGPNKHSLNQWERHTGCKAKKWKVSVKVKGTVSPLWKLLSGNNSNSVKGASPTPNSNSVKPASSTPFDEKQLCLILQEKYEPVDGKWTMEHCAICRRRDEYDDNSIVICNRCHIAVHQECYGVKDIHDFTSWVCRACETPEVKRECSLCPVKGGALKPTNIKTLWVHVICAWLDRNVNFTSGQTMEPVIGLQNIPRDSFCKKECVICKGVRGSCIKCRKCATYFHATCATRAGYHVELCSLKKSDIYNKWISYCAVHKAPENTGIIMRTPDEVIRSKGKHEKQNQNLSFRGSRIFSCTLMDCDSSIAEICEVDPFSAARCRIYRTSSTKNGREEAVFHRLMGSIQHSIKEIDSKMSHREEQNMYNLKEKVDRLQRTEYLRLCYGNSGVHGAGLFARREIKKEEMLIEYRGELVRCSVANLREARYKSEGKDCYFFKVSDDMVVDATNKGNLARLINHSCMPNCFFKILKMGENENRLVLISKTDIHVGGELTCDYMFDEAGEDELKIPCFCKAPNCRQFMN